MEVGWLAERVGRADGHAQGGGGGAEGEEEEGEEAGEGRRGVGGGWRGGEAVDDKERVGEQVGGDG